MCLLSFSFLEPNLPCTSHKGSFSSDNRQGFGTFCSLLLSCGSVSSASRGFDFVLQPVAVFVAVFYDVFYDESVVDSGNVSLVCLLTVFKSEYSFLTIDERVVFHLSQ